LGRRLRCLKKQGKWMKKIEFYHIVIFLYVQINYERQVVSKLDPVALMRIDGAHLNLPYLQTQNPYAIRSRKKL
jgi:hypothetical protein